MDRGSIDYEVRTPIMIWILLYATAGLAILCAGAIAFIGHAPASAAWACAVAIALPVIIWVSTPAYRVAGGRSLIRFYPDRIEVPHVSRRQLMVFPRDGLQIRLINVQVKYKMMMATVATVNRGKLVELRGAGQMRKFSTLIVARDDDTPFLVRDIEQLASGQPALGRDTPLVPNMPRTEYDDRLDRELSELD
jgi:hypothetical protein